MVMKMCLPKGERRRPRRGGGAGRQRRQQERAPAVEGGAGHLGAVAAPWERRPLALLLPWRWCSNGGALPLVDGGQGGDKFVAFGGCPKPRVFSLYIDFLDASWLWD